MKTSQSRMCIAFLLCICASISYSQTELQYSATDASNYMQRWSLLGPISISKDANAVVDAAAIEKFLNDAPYPEMTTGSVTINNTTLQWKPFTAPGSTINLDSIFQKDHAIAYGFADIIADEPKQTFLAVGSDDGIKVWHNGNLVHKNGAGRQLVKDQDLVAIPLVKGSNKIVVVVQDMEGGWGFSARLLDQKSLSERLIVESGRGNLDDIRLLLDAGADPNIKNNVGLSAVNAALLQGRTDAVKLLEEKGAKKDPMPDAAKLMDNLYGKMHEKKVAPGVALLVSKDGQILYKKAFGYADISKKEKITVDTKFRIGSITKQFTAAAILKLQEENKISVTDKLSKFFPDFPRADEVTIHHLLTHTSGIHSYTEKSDFLEQIVKPVTNEGILSYFKNDPYDFSPGEKYHYNNSAYVLLGFIIEKITGKTYTQYLQDTFFKPLGMKNTGIHSPKLNLKQEAKGYMLENGQYKPAPDWNMVWAGGAGAIYSTISDLHIWNEALYNGKVLNEKSLTAATTPVKLNDGTTPPDGRYGYGLILGSYRDIPFAYHGGGLHGFISQLARFQEENLNVVILTNISPPEINMNANIVAEFYLWDKMSEQPSVSTNTADKQNLDDFAGRYDFGNGMVMIITAEETGLQAQLTGQQKFPIFPSEPDQFFWKVVDAKIKFARDANGVVTGGHFTQGTAAIDVKKLQEEKIVDVDPSVFTKYVGKYDYGNNFIITVTTANKKLYAQGTNQPVLEIHPVSEKEFITREVSARILFNESSDGKVTSLTLDMGGQKKDAPKIE